MDKLKEKLNLCYEMSDAMNRAGVAAGQPLTLRQTLRGCALESS